MGSEKFVLTKRLARVETMAMFVNVPVNDEAA